MWKIDEEEGKRWRLHTQRTRKREGVTETENESSLRGKQEMARSTIHRIGRVLTSLDLLHQL